MKKHTPGVECDTCKKWVDNPTATAEKWLHADARVYGLVGKRAVVVDFCSAKCLAKWGRDTFFAEVVETIGEKPKLKKRKKKAAEVEGQTTIDDAIAEEKEFQEKVTADAS